MTGRDRKRLWTEWVGADHTIQKLWRDIRHPTKTVDASDREESKAKKAVNTIIESIKKGIVDGIKDGVDPSLFPSGDENHFVDKFGLGRIVDFARRELTVDSSRNAIRSNLSKEITKAQEKAQELICKVLLVASDAQTVTGILSAGSSSSVIANEYLRHRPYHYRNGAAEVTESLSSSHYL